MAFAPLRRVSAISPKMDYIFLYKFVDIRRFRYCFHRLRMLEYGINYSAINIVRFHSFVPALRRRCETRLIMRERKAGGA